MVVGRWAHRYAFNKRDLNNKIKELETQGYKITKIYEPCKCAKYYEIIYEIWSSKPLDKEEK